MAEQIGLSLPVQSSSGIDDFLIAGEKPTKRKIDHAKSLGINIISQSDLIKLIN